ncbi:MAG: glycosyltransferase family 2 protein [Chloroflexi bacterium]|nr:glycosyltransferase family 2 protein [Chloroflexota bacterium]
MRTGANPAKLGIPAYAPQRLGVAVIVYIPSTEGYFEKSIEILKYTLQTLRAATAQPFDLLVFDNGSCRQAVDELKALQARGEIDWLILSRHNLGKAGAWNWIFAAMPNEWIAYCDSDVLFRPGWLEASLEVLQAFPQAGMVSAQPNFYDVMQGEGKAHLALQGDPAYQFGEYWPERAVIDEYCLGIGASEEVAAPFYTKALPALLHKAGGVQAVIGASHMQFILRRDAARQVVPLPATRGLLRTETMSLDYKVDERGYLHLSTLKPYVFHMGNTVSPRLLEELRQVTGEAAPAAAAHQETRPARAGRWQRLFTRLARSPRLNPVMRRLYHLLFQALYSENRPQ